MKRLFIAVDLAIGVVEKLAVLQEDLQRHLQKNERGVEVRWVDAANLHLTLKFLGSTDEALVPMLGDVLEKLGAPLFPFEVECQGVGCFPSPQRPRILWAGIAPRGAEVLGLLQQAIERDLDAIGVPLETREFHPHVTLGRVRSTKPPALGELVERYADMRFGKSFIKDIVLYEAKLDHRGPSYHVIERFPLGSI